MSVATNAASRYRAQGAWREAPLHFELANAARVYPRRIAAVSVDGRTGDVRDRLSYEQLDSLTGRLAAALAGLGIGVGDTVAVMLPNRLEFSALVFAISRVGAVYTGIPPAAGWREAGFMLRRTGARALVLAPRRHGDDLVALGRKALNECPELAHIVLLDHATVSDRGFHSFDRLISAACTSEHPAVDAGTVVHIGLTSGTTGEPKGVMNTHQTLEAVWRNWVAHVGGPATLGEPAVNLVASPVTHHTGFLWGALLSAHLAASAVYLDRWVPAIAAEVISSHRVTTMHGAPTFLHDLVRVPGLTAGCVPSLQIATVAGAPIPRDLVPAAAEQLGAFICPAWGMTEYGIGISASPRLPKPLADASDGVPVPGCEVRITGADGAACGGHAGALEIRGPGLFIGYRGRPDYTASAIVDGWFQTGDLAQQSEDGAIVLKGRTKDIIIRGGENIPVVDLETILFRHPAIVEAAVIGVPDERLGERACAVLVCAGQPPSLADVTSFCATQGLSKHYFPERVEIVSSLPKTASGKVRKVELRAQLGASAAPASG